MALAVEAVNTGDEARRETVQRSMCIDQPTDKIVRFPYCNIWGWCGTADTVAELSVTANGVPMPFARVDRPDLVSIPHIGFSIYLNLPKLHQAGALAHDAISLELQVAGNLVGAISLPIDRTYLRNLDAIVANHLQKRQFLRRALKSSFMLPSNGPVNSLPSNWEMSPLLSEKKDPISAHHYGAVIQDFLNDVPTGGFVLDAGAGLRQIPYPNVINLEIYEYPSTDVLAIGQELPFRDGVFDAVLSLAVLEHVDDPLKCAAELTRVLKPGGKALVMVPFLQAEHGYPDHYFNATRSGVRKLFDGLSVERQFLDLSNHPINTLNEMLAIYASGLPDEERSGFLGMRVSDLLGVNPTDRWLDGSAIVHKLSEDAQWKIAWGTTTVFTKPG